MTVIISKPKQLYAPNLNKDCVDRMNIVSKKSKQLKIISDKLLMCLLYLLEEGIPT